jgi:hypothetical protein
LEKKIKNKQKKKKVGKKKQKSQKKKRNALWITVVIHSALGVGEQ